MTKREQLLQIIAAKIAGLPATSVARVAVDGVDGAGKTTFADELAACLVTCGRQIIRASVDGFHNPRAIRYRISAQEEPVQDLQNGHPTVSCSKDRQLSCLLTCSSPNCYNDPCRGA
jgi:pantothenate kinase-related protein Tda10